MIYIILAIILILIIISVVLYFTVFKEKNSEEKWSFIKKEDFKIKKDSNGHEYIECNILINSNSGEYKYIGMFDLIKRDFAEEYYRMPPILYNTNVDKLIDYTLDNDMFIFPPNFKYRITYVPNKGYKIDNISDPHILDPTTLYDNKLLKKPSNKLHDISQYLIDSKYLESEDHRDKVTEEMDKQKPQLFWDFEIKDNKLHIKTKDTNKSLVVIKDDMMEPIGLSTYNTKYNIKLQKTFPTITKSWSELMPSSPASPSPSP